jgi:3D (Asp-Asp-Asp) domain-containing protein
MKKLNKLGFLGVLLTALIGVFSFTSNATTTYAAGSWHTYTSQNVSAYVRYDASTRPSGGGDYYWGMGAVKYTSQGHQYPVIPFGSAVQTASSVSSPLGTRNTFVVKDTGSGSAMTAYFFDVWFGEWGNQDSALNWGSPKMTIKYYY